MNYGINLKALRERVGLTSVATAKIINVSDTLYSRYEKEKQTIPLKHLITLCHYFDVSLDYIFKFTDIKKYSKYTKKIDNNKIINRLKEFRKENNLTQENLANELNIARTIIVEYEKGKYLISIHALYTICKNYHYSADYLLGFIDKPKLINNN